MKKYILATLSILAASGSHALAQEANIEPETLTVEPRISEGNHVFVMDMGINGPTSIYVLNADDLSMEGNIGAGTFANMLMTGDKSTLFTSSAYMRRYTRGELEAVIEEYDPATLELRREIIVSEKLAQPLSQRGVLNTTADGAYLLAQNATPATSVSIVDLAAGAQIAEVPTPGCWTAYPAAEGLAFSTLCGDGRIVKYTFEADGSFSEPASSEEFFDPFSNPLFSDAHRIKNHLAFLSYSGAIYLVDDSGETPVLDETIEFASEGWAPSGYNLMTYHEPSGTLFIMMHPDPKEGSHKTPAEEIWAIDMENGKVVGRSEAHQETSIAVSGGEAPALFGIDHLGGVRKYDVSMGEEVTLSSGAALEGLAFFATILTTDF